MMGVFYSFILIRNPSIHPSIYNTLITSLNRKVNITYESADNYYTSVTSTNSPIPLETSICVVLLAVLNVRWMSRCLYAFGYTVRLFTHSQNWNITTALLEESADQSLNASSHDLLLFLHCVEQQFRYDSSCRFLFISAFLSYQNDGQKTWWFWSWLSMETVSSVVKWKRWMAFHT